MATVDLINHYAEIHPKEKLINDDEINFFSMISTMLSKFLPNISSDEHLDFYHKHSLYSLYKNETHDIQGNLLNRFFEIDDDSKSNLEKLKNKPHIITTFHLGLYLTNAVFLYENGIEFSALISSDGLNQNANRFKDIMLDNFGYNLNLIDAEAPNSILSLIREIKNGKSILIYVDGNLGASKKKNNLCQINFLHDKINVRKGVAYLAYLTKTPITSIINFVENNTINYRIANPFEVHSKENDKEVLDALWKNFSIFLKKHPEQWEVWKYLHKNIVDNSYEKMPSINESHTLLLGDKFKFNLDNYSLFRGNNIIYIMSKPNLKSYPISSEYYSLLKNSLIKNIICDVHNKKSIEFLLYKNLLVKQK